MQCCVQRLIGNAGQPALLHEIHDLRQADHGYGYFAAGSRGRVDSCFAGADELGSPNKYHISGMGVGDPN
jgi:hypothetical protein